MKEALRNKVCTVSIGIVFIKRTRVFRVLFRISLCLIWIYWTFRGSALIPNMKRAGLLARSLCIRIRYVCLFEYVIHFFVERSRYSPVPILPECIRLGMKGVFSLLILPIKPPRLIVGHAVIQVPIRTSFNSIPNTLIRGRGDALFNGVTTFRMTILSYFSSVGKFSASSH